MAPYGLQDTLDQGQQRHLVVTLNDHLRVSKPGDVGAYLFNDISVFVRALAGDGVSEDRFGLMASDDDALHDLALGPVVVDLVIACGPFRVSKLVPVLDPAGGDVPVVDADSWNVVLTAGVPSTLCSKTSARDALAAPAAVW